MNTKLTQQIVEHIFYCLGVNSEVTSIMQPQFLLSTSLAFEGGDKKSIWGIEMNIDQEAVVKILLADCSQEKNKDYALVILVKDTPTYGCYLSYTDKSMLPMIACSMQSQSWVECNVYLQATFLAGMEKIREFNGPFSKLNDENCCDFLFNFIDFYQEKVESNERKKD